MKIILTQVNELTFRLSADNTNIGWNPIDMVYDEFTDSTSAVLITSFENIISGSFAFDTGIPFEWSTFYTNAALSANIINVSLFNDSLTYYAQASGTTSSTTSALNPYYRVHEILNSSSNTADISTYYVQVSTGSIMQVPSAYQLVWSYLPEYDTLLKIGDVTGSVEVSGYPISATHLYLTAFQTSGYDTDYDIFSELRGMYTSGHTITIPRTELTFNPGVFAYVISSDTSYMILSAAHRNSGLLTTTNLIWNIDDTINTIGLTGASYLSAYNFGDVCTSDTIKISATDLTKIYTYTLSSYSGVQTGVFRPYYIDDVYTKLQVRVEEENNNPSYIYSYDLRAFGYTNDILHLFSPYQYLQWENRDTSGEVQMFYTDKSTVYNETKDIAFNIDNLKVLISPRKTTITPKICTAYFSASTFSDFSSAVYDVYDFGINYTEYLDSSIFNPDIRFQYEPSDVFNIYRQTTAGTNTYNISNISVLPANAYGDMTFHINDIDVLVPFTATDIPSGITYSFSPSGGDMTYDLSLTVRMTAPGFTEYVTKTSPIRKLIFTEIPNMSGAKIYPYIEWDFTSIADDKWKVLGATTTSPSSFSLGQTEGYYLTANDLNTSYTIWNVKNINGTIDETVEASSTDASISIKTKNESSYLNFSVIALNSTISADIPLMYYDIPEGEYYTNYTEVLSAIRLIGLSELGIELNNTLSDNVVAVPGYIDVNSTYTVPSNLPFNIIPNTLFFNMSSEFWQEAEVERAYNSSASFKLSLELDDLGAAYPYIPQGETTKIDITPELKCKISVKYPRPSIAYTIPEDWDKKSIFSLTSTSSNISAYPIKPLLFTQNKNVVIGQNVVYYNTVSSTPMISGFNWSDRDTNTFTQYNPYITSYSTPGKYSLTMTTYYSAYGEEYSGRTYDNVVNVFDVYPEYFSGIQRIYGSTVVSMPYNKEQCYIPINDFVTFDTVNASINKLRANLSYLSDISNMYDYPPTEYIGWYGSLYYGTSAMRTRWVVNNQYNSSLFAIPTMSINGLFNNIQCCEVKENKMYISNGNSWYILDSDRKGTILLHKEYKTLGDNYSNIRSIRLDNKFGESEYDTRLYILDSFDENNVLAGSKNRIIVYKLLDGNWIYFNEWGGLGGASSKNKFNKPNDFYIDDNNIIWIADTENKCIKSFTRAGSWLNTISVNDKPLGLIKENDTYYILFDSYIAVMDSTYSIVDTISIINGSKKIAACKDTGFVYVTYKDKVIKYALSSKIAAGVISENDFVGYSKDFRSTYHDEYRNLYIANTNHILKYTDLLYSVSLLQDVTDDGWGDAELNVYKDEYNQDWVINKCLHCLWDNIELFRRSILGKFDYATTSITTESIILSSLQPSSDFNYCDYDWLYNKKIPIVFNNEYTYSEPTIKTLALSEYKVLPYTKEEIFIGINEIHSADVYNRCFSKLYDCLDTILDIVKD